MTPPAPPSAPMLTPCATGWSETVLDDVGGVVACEPWPEGLAPCATNEARFPGDSTCVRVGGQCPASGFAEDLPASGTVLYVRAGAVAGDGTRDLPFATIGDALDVAPDGATVAIAPGSYDEAPRIIRPVTLAGACTDVVITHRGGVRVASPGVVLSRIRIDGAFVGLLAEPSGDVSLRGVEVSEARSTSISTAGGRIDGTDVLIRDAIDSGVGLSGGTARFTRLALVRIGGAAMVNTDGELEVDTASILDGPGSGPFPAILDASGPASRTTLDRVAIIGNNSSEVSVFDRAHVLVRDALIRRPLGSVIGSPFAIVAYDAAHVEVERTRIEGVPATALGASSPGSSLTATDVVVRGVVPYGDRPLGTALELSDGATATASRFLVAGARTVAVLVTGAGSHVALTDLTVLGTEPATTGLFGRAIQAQLGGTVVVERALIERSHEIGAAAAYEGSRLDLRDFVLRDTACAPAACPGPGIGVGAYLHAVVALERFVLEGNDLVGLQIALDGEADLVDGVIADSPVGVNVQVDGYDLARLTNRVIYRDNGTNLDTASLPVPDPATP